MMYCTFTTKVFVLHYLLQVAMSILYFSCVRWLMLDVKIVFKTAVYTYVSGNVFQETH